MGNITVKELIEILNGFDDDTVVEFEFNKERCPLTENFVDDGKLVFREKYRNIRHHIDGRYFVDHTSKKGFWIEDKATGKTYHFTNSKDIGKIRDILNEYVSEKRFTFYYERGNEVVIEDNGKRLSNKKVVDCLNEQQAQINKLKEENEKLKERRDYWSKKTKEFIYYFNCLEKAIEKTFDSDDQCFEEIWKHYDGMEKKWEYNDSFVGNWTDKPVLLERKMVNINENRDKQRLLAKQGKGISRRE